MKYKFAAKPGGVLGDKQAKNVGAELVTIEKSNGGITPDVVVQRAHSKSSAMHPFFTWDDGEAAEKCRLEEARALIRSVVIIPVRKLEGEPSRVIRAFVSVQDDDEAHSYMSTITALKSDSLREQILDRARRELFAWKSRYEHLKELAAVVNAIEELEK